MSTKTLVAPPPRVVLRDQVIAPHPHPEIPLPQPRRDLHHVLAEQLPGIPLPALRAQPPRSPLIVPDVHARALRQLDIGRHHVEQDLI